MKLDTHYNEYFEAHLFNAVQYTTKYGLIILQIKGNQDPSVL